MIIRNGIKSNIRAKGRTVLFSALILLLAGMLALSMGVKLYCDSMIKSSDASFRSMAQIEYLGAEYPDEDAADPFARDAADKLDIDALTAIDGVKGWMPSSAAVAVMDGLEVPGNTVIYQDNAVIRVYGMIEETIGTTYVEVDEVTDEEYIERITYWETIDNPIGAYTEQFEEIIVHQAGREPAVYRKLYYFNDPENGVFEQWWYKYLNDDGHIRENTITNPEDLPERYIIEYTDADYILHNEAIGLQEGDIDPVPALLYSEETYPVYYVFCSDGIRSNMTVERQMVTGYKALCEVIYSYGRKGGYMVEISTLGSDFVMERGKSYYLHGEFLTRSGVLPFVFTDFGADPDTLPYAEDVGGDESEIFLKYAAIYAAANSHIKIEQSDNIEYLYPFQQGVLYLQDGRFPNEGEEGVCVISGDISAVTKLGVGDKVTVSDVIGKDDDRYLVQDILNPRELTIIGVTNDSTDYQRTVWTPADAEKYNMYGYLIGTVILDNAKGRTAVEKIEKLAPEGVRVTLYDQNYENAIKPFVSMGDTAATVLMASAVGVFAVLALFAYLFIGRQSETVGILTAMGTPKRKTAVWMLSGAAVISGVSSIIGGALGTALLPKLIGYVNETAMNASNEAMPYSELSLGAVKQAERTAVALPTKWVWLAVGAIIAVSLILCLIFLGYAVRNSLNRKGKTSVRIPAGRTTTAFRGGLRFAFTSILRGGMRTLIVPVVSVVLTVLLVVVGSVMGNWEKELNDTYENTVLYGQLTSLNGRWHSGLVEGIRVIKELDSLEGIEDIYVSKGFHYWLSDEMPEFSTSEFGKDMRDDWIRSQPEVVALNSLSAAKEYYYSDPAVSWLDGWDESFLKTEDVPLLFFESTSTKPYPAVVSKTFLKNHELELGDEFSTSVLMVIRGINFEFSINLKAVGAYQLTGAKEQIYIPLSAYIDPEWDLGETDADLENVPAELHLLESFKKYATVSTCRFTLSSAKNLDEIRSTLYDAGYSWARHTRDKRTTVLLRDGAFLERIDTLEKSIAFGNMIYPVIFALIAVLGFVISWLMINGRKQEFAVMRGFGARKGRVFISFFLEQAILVVIGCGLGCLALIAVEGGKDIWLALGAYLACYLAGCAISVLLVGRMKLMELLSERD